jgi:site-specific DNA recombinase
MAERLRQIRRENMKPKNTAVILARVSSKSQEDEGYSLDSQLKLLQGYCQTNDLRVVKVYKIAETASKEKSRKIFSELLSFIAKNDIYNLAVEKTDRLTRNLRDAVAIDDWLQADKDRALHAVKENLRLHKEAKSDVKFMWNIHLAVAKKYTDNLREEAMKGWAEKLAQGWMPSRPPIGYMTAVQSGKRIHVPNPKTSPYVRKAFELYLQGGESVASIWAFLQQSGVMSYNGRPLAESAVHMLLQNTYYMGVITFNGETYPGAHQPLISKELFTAAQAKLHSKRPDKRRRLDALLRNVMTCGYCDKVITWEKQKGHLYGACQRDLTDCKVNKYLREELAHETIVDKLGDLISPSKSVIEWLIKHLEDEFKNRNDVVKEHLESIETRIARLEKMDEMLYDDKLAGDITRERYDTKHSDIKKQLQDLRDELSVADATLQQKHKEAIDIIRLTQSAKAEYLSDELSNDAKRTILTELFDSVIYKDNTISVTHSFFVQAIAEKSQKSREIMEGKNMLNRTGNNDSKNRGEVVEKLQLDLLCPVWQGHVESNHDLRFWRPLY